MENDVNYWRERCQFYERQTADFEGRLADAEELSAQKSSVIASLRSRLAELEEKCRTR